IASIPANAAPIRTRQPTRERRSLRCSRPLPSLGVGMIIHVLPGSEVAWASLHPSTNDQEYRREELHDRYTVLKRRIRARAASLARSLRSRAGGLEQRLKRRQRANRAFGFEQSGVVPVLA